MAAITKNGPWRLGASFTVGWVVFRFLASSHTWSPTQKGVNLKGMIKVCTWCKASMASFLVALMASRHWFRGGDDMSHLVWWMRGTCPMRPTLLHLARHWECTEPVAAIDPNCFDDNQWRSTGIVLVFGLYTLTGHLFGDGMPCWCFAPLFFFESICILG